MKKYSNILVVLSCSLPKYVLLLSYSNFVIGATDIILGLTRS